MALGSLCQVLTRDACIGRTLHDAGTSALRVRGGVTWHGKARRGLAWRGRAWRGRAWLGKARTTQHFGKESQTVQLAIAFDGTTGLLQHNPRLIDKFDDITREIAAINAKRTKTEADEAERDRLEWYGGLYHAQDIGVYMPAANIIRCMVDGGTAIKKGKAVRQGIAL